MVPDLDLQLQSAIKALTDTVTPAVDPADKMAAEQLHLVIATLSMVRDRLPVQRRFIRRLLEDAVALADQLNASENNSALTETTAAARAALENPELEAYELEAIRAGLTSLAVSLIAEAGSAGLDRFGAAIAKASKMPLDRLRAWGVCSGFEPDPAAVKPLKYILKM